MKKDFSLVAAVDAENGIGKEGKIPWKLSGDMAHFKKMTTTTQNPFKRNLVIMGRKTWDSLPDRFKPLPERINLVLTSQEAYPLPATVISSRNLDQAFEYMNLHNEEIESVYVIGGRQVYQEAIKLAQCKVLYLTHIFKKFGCDTFFPDYQKLFQRAESSDYREEDMITYHFAVYRRIESGKGCCSEEN